VLAAAHRSAVSARARDRLLQVQALTHGDNEFMRHPMSDRRTFLRGGVIASLVGGAFEPSAYAVFFGGEPKLSLHKVLVDSGLMESVAFGEIAASNGSPVHVFAKRDISDFWYDELDLVWRRRRVPVAGLTRHGPLFVLERFAWERGMRVVFRGEHLFGSADHVCHSLSGCREAVDAASDLVAAGADWAEALAAAAALTAPESSPGCSVAFESAGQLSCRDPLYSWVIA
jgi:hypothetical protein